MRFVSIDRNKQAATEYVNRTRLIQDFPVAFDFERDAKAAYKVFATPTLFVLNHDNQVVYKHVGVLSQSNIQEIRALIKK